MLRALECCWFSFLFCNGPCYSALNGLGRKSCSATVTGVPWVKIQYMPKFGREEKRLIHPPIGICKVGLEILNRIASLTFLSIDYKGENKGPKVKVGDVPTIICITNIHINPSKAIRLLMSKTNNIAEDCQAVVERQKPFFSHSLPLPSRGQVKKWLKGERKGTG